MKTCVNSAGKFGVVMIAVVSLATVALLGSGRNNATRSFEFIYITHILNVPAAGGRVRAWIPLPQTDKNQVISDLKIESPVRFRRQRELEYGNGYIYLEELAQAVPPDLEIRMSFRVARHEHRVPLNSVPSIVQPASLPTRPDLIRALAPDQLVPITGIIVSLSEQETRGLKKPLQKARAIYDYVTTTMRYDKSGEGWGRGDAVFACDAKRGNCTDFHSLLIGMMRAAGIPARFEIGFPIPTDRLEGPVAGYHCWAQVYVDPVGWIPVDSSEAWKNPAKRDYFFGANDENRVLFTIGRDIRLDPPQDGQPLNFFIYPYVEVGGKPFGDIKYQFAFRELPTPIAVGSQSATSSLR
jgi:transglutaminase-like putative cysteine protease